VSKRGAQVHRPAKAGEWTLKLGKREAADNWKQAANQWPGNCADAYDQLTVDPRAHSSRQHQLKGSEATIRRDGQTLEHWQYELTGGARIHYSIDDEAGTVWFEAAYLGHPKRTEKVKGSRKR
jgi:hypothetical protein